MTQKHLISIHELTIEDVEEIFHKTDELKHGPRNTTILAGKTLGMIFEKSSTRTRVSFEVGMYQLGGSALFLSKNDIQLGRGEPVSDTARVLSRYLDGIMARTFAHQTVLDLARFGSIPVINGLTDFNHPCQGLTDYYTIKEKFGTLKGLHITYIGDGNNMAHSLMYGAAKVGMNCTIVSPSNYQPLSKVVEEASADAKHFGCKINVSNDVKVSVAKADVLYTDVWASMGQEQESAERKKHFAGYQINQELLKLANPNAIVLHCLPAHRDEEITADVLEGSQSRVWDQAENRLHVQKAIMALLMA